MEEHTGEGGLLADALNDKEKLTKASAEERLVAIQRDSEAEEEFNLLQDYLTLVEKEAAAWKKVGAAQKALDEKTFAQYGKLTEGDIKTLVVEDKWLAHLATAVQGELDRVSQTLTGRLKQLAERYATPMPKLMNEVEILSARVNEHLAKMGFRHG